MRAERPARGRIEALADWALGRLKGAPGIMGADLVYYFSEAHSLSLRDGEPEENSFGVSGGIGIRTIARDGRQGVAYGNNVSREALLELIDWSRANCEASEPEENISLYAGPIDADESSLEQYDERIDGGIEQDERMRVCMEITRTARERDPRVASVRGASWSDGVGETFYASTEGVSGWRLATSASCGAAVVVSDGDSYELGAYGKSMRFADDLDGADYARLAVDRTTRILGGKPLATGRYSLLLDPEISTSIVDEIGELFCASEVHKGRSMMKGLLGGHVAGSSVTIVDDARLPRRPGSATFDGEGVPTGRTVLIESGVAKNYLYNLQYAAKDGVKSTGSASRGISGLPDVGTSNLMMMPGGSSRDSLLAGVDDGFLVLELMGLHTLNPVSGDFSLGAKGIRIKNGALGGPVAGVTVAGNLMDLLGKITAVGDDMEFFGSTGAPTVLVEGMTVAGY